MIIIDVQEPDKIKKAFKKLKIPFKVKPLKVGDFTNTRDTFIAERKSLNDFWSSMVDHRIDAQPKEMYEMYKSNRYVFVEVGSLADLSFVKRKPGWIYSKFGEIENWKCNFREYLDEYDLARKLQALDIYLGRERVVRERRKVIKGIPKEQQVLASFDNVGKKRAKLWLKELGSLNQIFIDVTNGGKKSLKIKGIGPKTISKMKNVILKKYV